METHSKMPTLLKTKLKIIASYAPQLLTPVEELPTNNFAWASGKEEDPSILCSESFNGTWLQTPIPRALDGESVGDWFNLKKNLPNNRGGKSNKSYIPPFDFQRPGIDKMKTPVFPVPLSFADPQCKKFFDNRLLFKDNIFPCNVNPSPLERGQELRADASQKSLAAIEAMIKESLAQNLGSLSLIHFIHKNVVENLKNLNYSDVTLTLWEAILTLVGSSLARNKQLLTSAIARLREFLRAQALRKLQGNRNSKVTADSWHFSDFGGQDLFGPVRSQVASWLTNYAQNGSGQDASLKWGSSSASGSKGAQFKSGSSSVAFSHGNGNDFFRKPRRQVRGRRGGGASRRGKGQASQKGGHQTQRGGKKGP